MLAPLIVQRLLRDVSKEEVPADLTVASEPVKVTGWFSAWRSEEMRLLPSYLRSWLLERGLRFGPENLLIRTYHVYMEPIEDKLFELELATAASPSSGNVSIGQKRNQQKGKEKKKIMLERNKSIKGTWGGEVRQKDINRMKAVLVNGGDDYEVLVEKMKHFLSGFKNNANFLQKIPAELWKDEDVKKQVSNYWIPAVERYFGTLERFIYYFWKTIEGKNAITALMSTNDPAVEQLLKENIDAFATARIKDWRDKVQEVYDSQSVES
jgi:hypothetical protein